MTRTPTTRTTRKPPTDRVFFTAAALYAALAVPLWTAAWTGGPVLWPMAQGVAAHGHEMVLGLAGALLSGFLFTRLTPVRLGAVMVFWLVGRVAVLSGAPVEVQAVALALHPAALALYGAWPFLKAAKTLHNAVPGVAVGLVVVAESLYVAGLLGLPGGPRAGVLLAFGGMSLMLFVMGGRLIPAATAGALRQKGLELPMARRLQRRAEAVGAAALGLMAVSDALAALGWLPSVVPGLCALVAGLAALLRLSRWRLGALLDQGSLWPLHLGYGWLGVGLVVKAAGQAGLLAAQASLHGVAVGGLGLLGATVAWRTVRQRRGRPLAPAGVPMAAAGLISTAAVLRLAGATEPLVLQAAAGLWALGWLLVAGALARS